MADVQHIAQRVTGTVNAKAFASACVAGNLLWGYVMFEDTTSTITSVVDDLNGAWTAIGTIKRSGGSAGSLQLFYRKDCAAGVTTVTLTTSAGPSTLGIHELSGYSTTSPLGQHNEAEGFVTALATVTLPDTTVDGELIVAACVSNRPLSADATFDIRLHEDFNLTSISEDKVSTAPGSYTATADLSSVGSWVICAATFKLAVGGAAPFTGSIDELAIYTSALTADEALEHYESALWTDVTEDLLKTPQQTLQFGIQGNGPRDRIANVGMMSFKMRNDEGSSGGLGYYSPVHVNCRPGFNYGTLVRLVFVGGGRDYQRYMGKIGFIDPGFGRKLERQTNVLVNDLMSDFTSTTLRNVTVQQGKTEAELVQTLVEALPILAQPLALHLDPGLDISEFAFVNLGPGQPAVAPLFDLIVSSLGFFHIGPTGVARYENRQARPLTRSKFTFVDDMLRLVVPTTLEGVFNHIRGTYHPKKRDAAATTVLWSQTGTAQPIDPGETIEVWGTYYNPTQEDMNIAGIDQVTPAATTDYLGNTLADGSGTNKTSALTVVAEPFGTTVKYLITNTDAGVVYLTKLQIRGRGLYDLSPVAVESISVQPYGDRVLEIDFPNQSNRLITQGLIDYLRAQFEALGHQAKSVTIFPLTDVDHLGFALTVEIGDRITISEAVTGLVLADVFVQGLQYVFQEGLMLECTMEVAATSFFDKVWILGQVGASEVGDTTFFGFA